MVDPSGKVPDLYFKVVDPKLEVEDQKSEVGELISGWIPPQFITHRKRSSQTVLLVY